VRRATRHLEILALRTLEIADRVAGGELGFLDGVDRIIAYAKQTRCSMNWRHKAPIPAGGFVAMLVPTLKSAAWREMSHGARSLHVALKMTYSRNRQNAVYLSVREAAEQLGSNKDCVARWFRELQHYGFIRQITPAYHGVGKGIAPHWRLTDEPYSGQPPTREFKNWDGQKFRSRDPTFRDTLSPKAGTPLPPKVGTPTPRTAPKSGDVESATTVPKSGDISSLPSPRGREGSAAEGDEAPGGGHEAAVPVNDLSIPDFLRRNPNRALH
jgi:hypothetical protein